MTMGPEQTISLNEVHRLLKEHYPNHQLAGDVSIKPDGDKTNFFYEVYVKKDSEDSGEFVSISIIVKNDEAFGTIISSWRKGEIANFRHRY